MPRLRAGDYLTPLEEEEVEGDRPICDPEIDGTFPVVGSAECQPLGDPCPDADWPEVPAEIPGARFFVRDGEAGGDGTMESPYGSVSDAVTAAGEGDVIVIAPGTYEEALTLEHDMTLWGTCARDVTIAAPSPYSGSSGAVTIRNGAQVTLRNLHLTGARLGIYLEEDTQATCEGLWIDNATGYGVRSYGGDLFMRGSLVNSTHPRPDNERGHGIDVFNGGVVTLEATTVEDNNDCGIVGMQWLDAEEPEPGAEINLDHVVVRGTRCNPLDDNFFGGVEILYDSQATISNSLISGNCAYGIFVSGNAESPEESPRVVVEGSLISDTSLDENGEKGTALYVRDGAVVTLEHTLISRNRTAGIKVNWSESSLVLNNVVVADTRGRESDGLDGFGLILQNESMVTAHRTVFDGNTTGAISVAYEGAVIELNDVAILDTRSQLAEGLGGIGVDLSSKTRGTLRRALVEDNRYVGIHGVDADLTLEDVTVRGTRGQEDRGLGGFGIVVETSSKLSAHRVLIEESSLAGLALSSATEAIDVEDLIITDTEGAGTERFRGRGIDVSWRSRLEATRVELVRSRFCAVSVWEDIAETYAPGRVTLSDVSIVDTLGDEDNPEGAGLCVATEGVLEINRASIRGSHGMAIIAEDEGSSLALSDVRVSETQVTGEDITESIGVLARGGAEIRAERLELVDNLGMGVMVSGAGSELTATDLVVEGSGAQGLVVTEGGSASFIRAAYQSNRTTGLSVEGEDSALSCEDLVVRGTLGTAASAQRGHALRVVDGADASVLRAHLEENRDVAIVVSDEAHLRLEDLAVVDTLSADADGRRGRAINAGNGATVAVTRGVIRRARDAAVAVFGEGTEVSLEMVSVLDTRQQQCIDLGEDDPLRCPQDLGRGYGVGVYDGASIMVSDVVIVFSQAVGLQLARQGMIEGERLEVRGHSTAINLVEMADTFDVSDVVTDLLLDENDEEISVEEISVPGSLPF